MKIIADENIPYVSELFGNFADVTLLAGREINAARVKNADILLVRSVTPVNANLLTDSKVRFVGTATAGVDHLDTVWLTENNIVYADAKGSNAEAVAEYVVSCIAYLRTQGHLQQSSSAAIIGVGQIGKLVATKLALLGFQLLLNDPLRAENERDFPHVSLTAALKADLICLHTPLTRSSKHPTYHLISAEELKQIPPKSILLNAGRGAVIDNHSLSVRGKHLTYCLDVWENEPNINVQLLKYVMVATPHVAGYTLEAKLRGTLMLYQAAQSVFQLPSPVASPSISPLELALSNQLNSWEDVLLSAYHPSHDTEKMRAELLNVDKNTLVRKFDALRRDYARRHEFNNIILKNTNGLKANDLSLLKKLGFKLKN